jgi:hypothetical protein
MEKVGSTAQVNVVVQWDRSGNYDDSVDWAGCRRYLIQKDTEGGTAIVSTLIQDMGEVDMGIPQSLTDFIRWGVAKYPASHYAVILWNHGGGWRDLTRTARYICLDESSGNDLDMPDLRQGFADAFATTGKVIDLVGMDACLMGNVEVAYQLKDYAKYTAFSEESEDGAGWPYDTILADLIKTPTMSAIDLGKVIVSRYGQYYAASTDATQSLIDVSKLQALLTAINNFTADARAKMGTEKSALRTSAIEAIYMSYSDYRDLGDFCDQVAQNVSDDALISEAQAIKTAEAQAVLAKFFPTSRPGYSGLTIWLPSLSQYDQYSAEYMDVLFPQNTQWDEFLGEMLN